MLQFGILKTMKNEAQKSSKKNYQVFAITEYLPKTELTVVMNSGKKRAAVHAEKKPTFNQKGDGRAGQEKGKEAVLGILCFALTKQHPQSTQ